MSSIQAGRDMKKILCRFYKNGNCRKGTSLFLVCRNFLTGSCIYGSSCRYDHIPQTWVFRNLEKVGFPIDNEASKGETETAASHVDLNDRTQTSASTAQSHNDVPANVETVVENGAREEILCGYYVLGNCPFGENCKYVHGDMCELCKRQILRPGDDAYKLMHQQKFQLELQRLIAASSEKECGICLETVIKNKENCKQTSGILSIANIAFGLSSMLNCITFCSAITSLGKHISRTRSCV
ncbi:putative E3 ubiquitin-protein ligase makorin-2 [Trichinella pseudospiralis]|uniref:RING-type E3 ubiquitin transferase n=1 Tax=Trichinella pseudospiralis TaxID=6337 RepID=A0A0V1JD62_TRIPS|nr:putative E3 ubiquitin-protein ligase makorin-2 [Trichinella pseudospiralis]KRZ32915.1 putative E3 ubiquitin-protein ligase makorin-2 [Trichinella pseudospiralis]